MEGGREEREVETLCCRMGRKSGRSVRMTWAPRRARVMPTCGRMKRRGEWRERVSDGQKAQRA